MRSRLTLVALAALAGCNSLVDVEAPLELPLTRNAAAEPLRPFELLRFTGDNLGEVEPGLLYRSNIPSRAVLEFLARRANLGHVWNLRGRANDVEREVLESVGGSVTSTRMSVRRPPTPRQILELIRLTHKAHEEGRSLLVHCRAGADRTGIMVAIWRMLFQGVTDRDALRHEMWLHRHVAFSHPLIQRTLDLFRPELFRPFVDDPSLIEDPEKVAELESRYYRGQPLISGASDVRRGKLRAAAARVDLLEGLGDSVQMATYGPRPGTSRGVREPVFARALVLDAGGRRVAVVSCDLLLIDLALRSRVLERLEQLGSAVDDLLLCATHTHTSIGGFVDHRLTEFYILGPYQAAIRDHLVDRIAGATVEAESRLAPARLGLGRTFVDGVSCNRRIGDTVDPEVGIIKVTDDQGQPLAVVVNFAAHPILEPDDGLISSDYPGLLARHLDERHGFGLFLQGALGDVNACPEGDPDLWIRDGLAERVAERLAAAVDKAVDGIATRDEVELGSMTTWLVLPPLNIHQVPDLLFPLDWLLGMLLDWPSRVPLQAVRIGDAELIACSTEAGVRLGLAIKRRSPAPYPWIVTHANGYGGYAVTQVNHSKSKLDPTSLVLQNGSTYGARLVEAACDLLEAHRGERLDPRAKLLSPASRERLEGFRAVSSPIDLADRKAELIAAEEEATLARVDPTQPQNRGHGRVSDSLDEMLRLDLSYLYLEELRGGTRALGRRREISARLRAAGPWDTRWSGTIGQARSDWKVGGVTGSDEGVTDLLVQVERPWSLWSDHLSGSALRLIPALSITAPTGDANSRAPFRFSAASGVWRPAAGGALEFTWETYRTLTLETLYTTSFDPHRGRRPGDRWSTAFRYGERHGLTSLYMDLEGNLQLADRRTGGRRPVDVEQVSFDMALVPGLSIHAGEHVEFFARASAPLLKTGTAGGAGRGAFFGLRLAVP